MIENAYIITERDKPLSMAVRANAAKPFAFTVDCDRSAYDWAVPLMVTGEWVGK